MVFAHAVDDFVLIKSDGLPLIITVVVDDRLMGITHVILARSSVAPRQIQVYEAFGFPRPDLPYPDDFRSRSDSSFQTPRRHFLTDSRMKAT